MLKTRYKQFKRFKRTRFVLYCWNDIQNVYIWQLGDVMLQILVVAAEQFGERRADGSPVPIDNQLQHVLVHFHHHGRLLLSRHEEDDGEESHLKLGTHTKEAAAKRLHQTLPAELQVQDVVILVRLEINEERKSIFIFLLSAFSFFTIHMRTQCFLTVFLRSLAL